MYPAANISDPRAGSVFPSKIPKIVPNVLLLLTFEEPSRGSRTIENRPPPTRWTSPISSEATCETSFESRKARTKRSFIHTSSSSCCSPYTLRVAAGSLRTGSSRRIRVARPANRENRRPRSRSALPACCASVTPAFGPPLVADVPSLELIQEFLLAAVEVPPRSCVAMGEVREDLEILHALRSHVRELRLEAFLAEGVLPDRATREEAGRAALAGEFHEVPEDPEFRSRA